MYTELTLIDKVRTLFLLRGVLDDPTKLNGYKALQIGIKVQRSKMNKAAIAVSRQRVDGHPDILRLYQEQYFPSIPDIRVLACYPEGTLGQRFGQHMLDNNLDVEFYPPLEVTDVYGYFVNRVARTHDIVHAFLGCDTSPTGEMAVAAFCMAQGILGLFPKVLALFTLHLGRKHPEALAEAMVQIGKAQETARKIPLCAAIKWEMYWDKPISELRAILEAEHSRS